MKARLVDTGPLVAYLNQRDRYHLPVCESLERFSGQLLTTTAVIVEAMFLVARQQGGPGALAELVASSGLEVVDFSARSHLQAAAWLMEKYSDVPMDFADATLVLLAEQVQIFEIFTLDRRGFSVFRTRDKRAFSLIPQLEPSTS
ncbi:MAG TPA: PIN domain-containing protein [Thermoanaerobaculia bacterium]|nr:PIN domain-containing protein [Thermoanaerobaculia bacterium]